MEALEAHFNPGFSVSHITSLIPGAVELIEVFKNILDEHAKTEDIFLSRRSQSEPYHRYNWQGSHVRTCDKILRECELP
jgi:acyl-CoA hydrolase